MSSHCLQSILKCSSSMRLLSNIKSTDMQFLNLTISGELIPSLTIPVKKSYYRIEVPHVCVREDMCVPLHIHYITHNTLTSYGRASCHLIQRWDGHTHLVQVKVNVELSQLSGVELQTQLLQPYMAWDRTFNTQLRLQSLNRLPLPTILSLTAEQSWCCLNYFC